MAQGVEQKDFNSYGSRRGNHEVMMRGTFANIRLRNQLAPGTEGGWTVHIPSGKQMTIYDGAMQYKAEGVPLVVLAGREYGTGSSRDWAAKGPSLLGVRVVIAQSYERIHRSNLIGMGILPLQYVDGEDAGGDSAAGVVGGEGEKVRSEESGPPALLTFSQRAKRALTASNASAFNVSLIVSYAFCRLRGSIRFLRCAGRVSMRCSNQ